MTKRIYTPPVQVMDKNTPHWKGDTARRVMTKRIKGYVKEKRMKMMARRKKSRAHG